MLIYITRVVQYRMGWYMYDQIQQHMPVALRVNRTCAGVVRALRRPHDDRRRGKALSAEAEVSRKANAELRSLQDMFI